ncbi:HET-domain-containing protein [Tothia fuscella]|uniref:HET-domain-containing protein n=1 Tax=Tothia fuscella TaxID=1048955 RepID=A0A9P4NY63_9PEZI|nr:HET-domain-containing protein [Tothia fuscella]
MSDGEDFPREEFATRIAEYHSNLTRIVKESQLYLNPQRKQRRVIQLALTQHERAKYFVELEEEIEKGPYSIFHLNSSKEPEIKVNDFGGRDSMSSLSESDRARFWSRLSWPDRPKETSSSRMKIDDHETSISPSQPTAEVDFECPLYSPLYTKNTIRLLKINPGRNTDPVSSHLEIACLDERRILYEALSYVWGDANDLVDVHCNQKIIKITRSLSSALQRLRYETQPRYIWADAVCINQEDIAERGHQVRLMRSIYRNASAVLVYLGQDPDAHAITAFSVVSTIANAASEGILTTEKANFTSNGVNSDGIENLPGRLGTPPPDSSLWNSVAHLYNLTWFWRLWCIQEVALASTAVFIWGGASISWRWLGLASARIRTNNYQAQRRQEMTGVFNAYFMFRIWQGEWDLQPLKFSFLRLMGLTRQFESSDSRDRVFGLLGLPTTDNDPESEQLFIEPDYNLSPDEVYEKLAITIREVDSNLQLLSSVQHGSDLISDKVSWIPRWDNVYTHTLAPSDPENHHETSAGLHVETRGSGCTSIWSLKGLEVNTVHEVLSPVRNDRFLTTDSFAQMSRLHHHIWTPETRKNACWTLTAGKDWYGLLIKNSDGAARLMRDFSAYVSTYYPQSSFEMANDHNESGDVERFIEAASNACKGRRLFFTYSGLLGLGPAAMREGDKLCVLFGGEMPYILRSEGTHFRFIGECYVYDLMEGKAIQHWRNGTLFSKYFDIC